MLKKNKLPEDKLKRMSVSEIEAIVPGQILLLVINQDQIVVRVATIADYQDPRTSLEVLHDSNDIWPVGDIHYLHLPDLDLFTIICPVTKLLYF